MRTRVRAAARSSSRQSSRAQSRLELNGGPRGARASLEPLGPPSGKLPLSAQIKTSSPRGERPFQPHGRCPASNTGRRLRKKRAG